MSFVSNSTFKHVNLIGLSKLHITIFYNNLTMSDLYNQDQLGKFHILSYIRFDVTLYQQ